VRLTRVYVDAPLRAGQQQPVEGGAANHIIRVLRLRVGDELTLFDGRGGEYAGKIDAMHRDDVLVTVLEQRPLERESPLQLTLAQGVSRGERMDWVMQKATELGVARIAPIFTERSIVRLDAKQAQKKVQHWRSIIISACEQSGRNRVPEISMPVQLHEFLDRGPLGASGSDGDGAPGVAPAHAAHIDRLPGSTRLLLSPRASLRIADVTAVDAAVAVLIGPEGGLTDNEQEWATSLGFTPVRMGPRVLRTETAAVAALALLQQKFGDL
jgi:16S rRNA (uracil1498-N3)-methyltransferase